MDVRETHYVIKVGNVVGCGAAEWGLSTVIGCTCRLHSRTGGAPRVVLISSHGQPLQSEVVE